MKKWESNKKNNRMEQRGEASYSESLRAKWFCCTFKVSFLQLICKASLILKLNLELALSVILKERELHESRYAVVDSRCLNVFLDVLVDETYYPFWYVHQS